MLRSVLVYSALASAILLSGCHSMHWGNGSPDINSTKSAIDYNQWQWNHYSRFAGDSSTEGLKHKQASLINDPVMAIEATDTTTNTWGYRSQPNTIHPANWGKIKGSAQCNTGNNQSPLNITNALVPASVNLADSNASQIKYQYQAQDFKVANDGHTITFTATDGKKSKFLANGKEYQLVQFQYHSPSEHAIMNVHYPLELQFIHKSEDGEMAIISSLVNVGQQNESLQPVIDTLPVDGHKQLKDFNVDGLIPTGFHYAYTGSMTRPPCMERVAWLIGMKPITASSQQVYSLRSLFYGNNRPLQPQNNRTVFVIR